VDEFDIPTLALGVTSERRSPLTDIEYTQYFFAGDKAGGASRWAREPRDLNSRPGAETAGGPGGARFHQVILDHTHNQFTRVMADALRTQLHRVRQSAEQGLHDSALALAERRMILNAVKTGNPAKAEAAMKRHMDFIESRSGANLALAEADRGRAEPGTRQ